MVHPSPEELLNTLRNRLEDRSEGDGHPPTLVISDEETVGQEQPGG